MYNFINDLKNKAKGTQILSYVFEKLLLNKVENNKIYCFETTLNKEIVLDEYGRLLFLNGDEFVLLTAYSTIEPFPFNTETNDIYAFLENELYVITIKSFDDDIQEDWFMSPKMEKGFYNTTLCENSGCIIYDDENNIKDIYIYFLGKVCTNEEIINVRYATEKEKNIYNNFLQNFFENKF